MVHETESCRGIIFSPAFLREVYMDINSYLSLFPGATREKPRFMALAEAVLAQAADLAAPGTNLYTVTIQHLTKYKAEGFLKDYAGASMREEEGA